MKCSVRVDVQDKEKYNKEWYVCDRCGQKIGGHFKIPTGSGFIHGMRRAFLKPKEYKGIIAEKRGYITNAKHLLAPEIVGVDIVEYYEEKEKTIHLCGKCRKEFERFMKNV